MNSLKIVLPLLLLVGVGAAVFWPKNQAQQEGPATAVDAGVLEIGGTRHRLSGIVAPRSEQLCVDHGGQSWDCGRQALGALQALVAGTPVLCRPRAGGDDLADCFVGGKSLSELMVRKGWALACRSGRADYSGTEDNPRFLALGLWRGGFEPPVAPDSCPGRGARVEE